MPHTPFSPSKYLYSASRERGFIDDMGKNVALPLRELFKNSMRYLASSSLRVTIFCTALPSAVSIAVSYPSPTLKSEATTPSILSDRSLRCFASESSFFTLYANPS